MFPQLFTIPFLNVPIHTYGVLIVAGFLLAVYIAYRQCVSFGKYENDILDYAFWALVGGLIGARIVFIMVEWRSFFIDNPFTEVMNTGIKIPTVFALWQGGLVYWGSFLGGMAAFFIFAKARRLPMGFLADVLVLGVPLAQMFGRLGCVAAGCCYGGPAYHLDEAGHAVADVPFALSFPPGSSAFAALYDAAPTALKNLMMQMGTTVPLFPSQLAEALGCAVLFFILYFIASRKSFHGQVVLSYLILYSILRSFLELFRGDAARGYVIDGVLSTSQFISLLVVLGSLGALLVLKKRAQKKVSA